MERGFIYVDPDEDEIQYRLDGTIAIIDANGEQRGELYLDYDEFIGNQDEDYLKTIVIAGLLPATYQDADGNLIRVFKNGKIKYDGKRYPSFKKFQQSQTDNFFDNVTLPEDDSESDPDDSNILFKQELTLKRTEAVCLATECRRPKVPNVRQDQDVPLSQIHDHVTYTFLDWNESDEKYAKNHQWLVNHHKQMVCILSVSLAKLDQSTDKIDDTRRTMLLNAITSWTDYDWSVLLFVPAQNKAQYEKCAKLQLLFGDGVRIVPYRIVQGTCNNNMNVGESRNAILHFVRANIDVMKTCTVADERVEALQRPRPVLSNCDFEPSNEPVAVARIRKREGYQRLALVNKYLQLPTANKQLRKEAKKQLRKEFIQHQSISDAAWSALTKREQAMLRTVVQVYDSDNEETSIWHALKSTKATLIGLPTEYRAWMRKTDPDELPEPTDRYEQWGESEGDKFLGADVAPFAPDELVMPTQLITFKVGEGGWNGQFFYPFTTIGEDNFFSYQWGRQIGPPEQLDAITIVRKFPKRAVSITRTPDDLSSYTNCAIKELMYVINSGTYSQRSNFMPVLQWTPYSKRDSLSMNCYKWQCFIFSQVAAEASKRHISVPEKVENICTRVLEFILSKQFRKTTYFTEKTKETYNKMMGVYKKNMKRYIQTKGLKIPKNR